jgi:hypothetical protein
MAHTNQNGDEEIESFKIDPTFEFNAPKCYDFLHQDTEDELRECDEFFRILSDLTVAVFQLFFVMIRISPSQTKMSRNTTNVTLFSTKNAPRIYGNG